VLFLCPNNAKLVGWERVWGLLQPGFVSWAPPPLLHMTTLTTVRYLWHLISDHNNYELISDRFQDKERIRSKNANFLPPVNLIYPVPTPAQEELGLLCGKFYNASSVFLIRVWSYQMAKMPALDRRADGQTDIQKCIRPSVCLSAS